MVIAVITVTDADSLDAAADVLEDAERWITCTECNGKREIVDYSPGTGWIGIACPACEGNGSVLDLDADDWDPEPPSPAASAVLPDRCRECNGTGTKRYWVGGRLTDWIEERCRRCDGTGKALPACCCCQGTGMSPHPDHAGRKCWLCDGTGRDPEAGEATPPTTVPFDRVAHCRRIASYGGMATLATHGYHHFRIIGQTGARVTTERHGYDFWRGIITAKGWTAPRQVCFLDDLRAGRELAALDRIAA
jgi:hypothetical protein